MAIVVLSKVLSVESELLGVDPIADTLAGLVEVEATAVDRSLCSGSPFADGASDEYLSTAQKQSGQFPSTQYHPSMSDPLQLPSGPTHSVRAGATPSRTSEPRRAHLQIYVSESPLDPVADTGQLCPSDVTWVVFAKEEGPSSWFCRVRGAEVATAVLTLP